MTDLTGRTLGRYRLESLLGRGGMAEVWRATDTKLARTVAVKVIHASYAQDPQFAERFLREARVVASLDHPNILPVYDFGDEGGIPFLVMPHLPGGTLRDRLRGVPAPLPVAAEWIRQLAAALDAAHAAGVLHRDVKPANVLLGKDGRLFLSDFGIAKMVETITGLTATGVVVGTPVYMAPEQAQGQPASPASDRYALAVVAYEILAGRPPFDGDNPLSLMHQHVSTPPPALSSRVGGLPAGLDAVFRQALAKDPAARPPACRALADAVSAFLPTGALPAVGSAEWGTPASGMTAPTVLQERAATPPRVRVATPPPSLTSDATVLTAGRRSRHALAWGAGAAAVAVVGFVLAGRARDAARVAPAAAPISKSAPTAAPSAVPTPVPTAAPTVAPTAVPSSPAIHAPPTPAAPAPPIAEKPGPAAPALAAAHERLDVSRRPGHRLGREDFQFVQAEARRVLADHPKNPDARSLATFATGGLAYVSGNDAVASALVVDALAGLRHARRKEPRILALLVMRPDGTMEPPRGWELALCYGDARGEALDLLDTAIRENPRDVRARRARAQLRRARGLASP